LVLYTSVGISVVKQKALKVVVVTTAAEKEIGHYTDGSRQDVILDSWYGFYFVLETAVDDLVSWIQQKESGSAAILSRQHLILLPLIGPLNV
jgi:hypothetical protein